MSRISNYLENKLINHTLRNTAYTSPGTDIYISLHTADPGETGASELAGGGYERVNYSTFDAPASRATANTNAIQWGVMLAAVGSATHAGVWDAQSGGNFLWATSAFSTAIATAVGVTPTIAAGDLDISFAGEISTYLANELLDHVFRNASYTTPGTSIYVSLHTSDPGLTGAGEVSGNSYARVQHTAWDAPADGDTENSSAITFATPSPSDWGSITHVGVWDASTSGNFLFGGALDSTFVTDTSNAPEFQTGDLDITVA